VTEEHKELMKQAIKEAAREWLDDVYRTFGKWGLRAVGAAFVVALLYFILTLNGWSHVPSLPTVEHTSE